MKKLLLLFLMAFAINSHCQTAGNGVTDIDGHTYNTVIIGTQEWMAENLKTSIYLNGDQIANVSDGTLWSGLTTGAWAYYNNESQYECPFGKLYNWYAVADPRHVCPSGWREPTETDWATLIEYLGGESSAGGKMKSTGTSLWISPNTDATNESGFTGLPGGYRFINGTFSLIGLYGFWWSPSEHGIADAWSRTLDYSGGGAASSTNNKRYGFSMRCIKD
jgi:uncharacterized protein (TIGR02145 family)